MGHSPSLSWSFAVPVGGFASLQEAIDHALSVYFGDQPEVQPKLTEQQRRAFARVYEAALQAGLRAEQEEKEHAAASRNVDSELLKDVRQTGYSEWVEQLSIGAGLVLARDANGLVPKGVHGLYAIYIDNERNLPGVFGTYLKEKRCRMLYLGKAAQQTLHTRIVTQDLQHRKPSTFFRGLGAVLGFRPPKGSLRGKKNQNNYTFSPKDTQAIVEWIDSHLSVCWFAMSPEEVSSHEFFSIYEFRPPFNTAYNRDALPELASLKEQCRRLARS
jgi:hypothetical protein